MKNKWWQYLIWIIVIGWIGFSMYYIGRDYVTKYVTNVNQTAYQKGVTDSVNSLITEAKKCQPVTAYNKDEKIELIWTDCLKQTQPAAENPVK